ncbi:arginyl-tRNA--protein transferase 1 isoform X2 [Boleophthalmus pectinirostris]|uniref:arginyl-tRNA--protein transferase 1 isoform X2 n=1 Tax=Boleophthalmus pectinirostris TaxID=150288 RepID=UPI00242F15C6|nr:arginyl-tRNA--protein transferase 1 isoform X2 [Boleophthalmus pectinirostris]
MAENKSYTIVEYFGGDSGYQCGYCKNSVGNFSHGMWSHTMTVQDYQDLIDRGWRRSGKYVYKPILNKTCCPQYTIRCHALKFQPSKSHKKILKKMSKFLSKGDLSTVGVDGELMVCDLAGPREPSRSCPSESKCPSISNVHKEDCPTAAQGQEEQDGPIAPTASAATTAPTEATTNDTSVPPTASAPKPGTGADPNKPPCRKAKDIRNERRLQKEQKRQSSDGIAPSTKPPPTGPSQSNQPKSLEDFIEESLTDGNAHSLEVRLVPVNFDDPQFTASYEQSAALFARYQIAIHNDEECDESEFRRFLCDSPLEAENSDDGPEMGYGSFHQQYWLDGRIVAVGVVDILPSCVSSVYLYYDPEFASLSLGSYSALREIAFTRQLQKQSPKLCYYYLGFYIHSCPKMRYKGQYRPSDLLCPETFTWVSIERCVPKLDQSRYARFNQDPNAEDARMLKEVDRALVLYKRTAMPYGVYCRKRKGSSDEAEVKQYASLVGQDCAQRILLFRP